MTNTAKEIFEKHQVRKSRKQRTDFIEYAKDFATKHGYEAKVEKGSFRTRNIVVGNPDTAKVIYTAHYDTCASMFFPNFIAPKNFLVYLIYQLAIVVVFFLAGAILTIPVSLILSLTNLTTDVIFDISYNLMFVIVYVLLFLMMFGPANKHTANDNTSGVITLLEIMSALPTDKRNEVAFVFFDLEELGLIGSSSFASKHKNVKKNTLVLNFDCVSDGDTMFFALKRTTKKYKDVLEKAFESDTTHTVDVCDKFCFYPSDNACFKGGVGVSALKKTKSGILYMDKIHTPKDTVFTDSNIEFFKNGAIKLIDIL